MQGAELLIINSSVGFGIRRGQLGSASSHSNLQVRQRERGRAEERIKEHLEL